MTAEGMPVAALRRACDLAGRAGSSDAEWRALGRELGDVVDEGPAHARPILADLAVALQREPPGSPAAVRRVLASLARAVAQVPARYADRGRLGHGGMAEVRAVWDPRIGRVVALKTPRPHIVRVPRALERFVAEGELTAGLQHPGVVPVHDRGLLADGRPFFTMRRVEGETLAHGIAALHGGMLSAVAVRPLVRALHQVCLAVAYAHSRGVVHRDLKPANVMIGANGEVLVMDWGLGAADGPADHVGGAAGSGRLTVAGEVLGTPAYMAPEEALGEHRRGGMRADVYGLGAILYEILAGRPPFTGRSVEAVLSAVVNGPPPPPQTGREWASIVAICERAMARRPEERFADAGALAGAVAGWLDDAHRRDEARAVVREADALVVGCDALLARANALRERAAAALADIPRWAPEGDKAAGWALEDEAAALELQVARARLDRRAQLRAALVQDPQLPEAHAALAELQRAALLDKERSRDADGAALAEVLLRRHTEALPPGHPVRRRCAATLEGTGAVTLVTEPPGLEVSLFRYERHNKRLVPMPVGTLGRTPLRRVPLDRGSFLLRLGEVAVPVSIGREEHWDAVPPGGTEPYPIVVPDDPDPDDCYVPAGWFASGSAGRRVWCHGFVIRRFPVTNAEYITFLNALVEAGSAEAAARCEPRESGDVGGVVGASIYGRDPAGRYAPSDRDGWQADRPVRMVNWASAAAFAQWLASHTGKPWRLPAELEWEKAARGVDGRSYGWGDDFDASWCHVVVSSGVPEVPEPVDSYPVDASPYGVRGMAGNVADWVGDAFVSDGPVIADDRVALPDPVVGDPLRPDAPRPIRGGHGRVPPRSATTFSRVGEVPAGRYSTLGFRVARSL